MKFQVLLIWDVYPWSQIWIFPILDPGSRMHIKEFKYSTKWFLSSQKYDPCFPSRIRIPDLDPDFLPIPDPEPGSQIPNPGIKKAPDPWSWIRIRNTRDFGFAQAVGGSIHYWLSTGTAILRTHSMDQLLEAFLCKKNSPYILFQHYLSIFYRF